jgi:hypothetical protein
MTSGSAGSSRRPDNEPAPKLANGMTILAAAGKAQRMIILGPMFARTAVWLTVAVLGAAQDTPPGTPPPGPKFIPSAPVQPIPFSHRTHIAAGGLDCKSCHPVPDPGDFATIPETSKCMSCHHTVKKDSPAVQRLADFHNDKKDVPWRRVYRIPDYVYFSHKAHLAKGIACESCHGPVRERDVLRKEKETSMAACMDCHRAKQASLACNYCHEQK